MPSDESAGGKEKCVKTGHQEREREQQVQNSQAEDPGSSIETAPKRIHFLRERVKRRDKCRDFRKERQTEVGRVRLGREGWSLRNFKPLQTQEEGGKGKTQRVSETKKP